MCLEFRIVADKDIRMSLIRVPSQTVAECDVGFHFSISIYSRPPLKIWIKTHTCRFLQGRVQVSIASAWLAPVSPSQEAHLACYAQIKPDSNNNRRFLSAPQQDIIFSTNFPMVLLVAYTFGLTASTSAVQIAVSAH